MEKVEISFSFLGDLSKDTFHHIIQLGIWLAPLQWTVVYSKASRDELAVWKNSVFERLCSRRRKNKEQQFQDIDVPHQWLVLDRRLSSHINSLVPDNHSHYASIYYSNCFNIYMHFKLYFPICKVGIGCIGSYQECVWEYFN